MKVYLELTGIALMEEVASSQRDKLLIRLLSSVIMETMRRNVHKRAIYLLLNII